MCVCVAGVEKSGQYRYLYRRRRNAVHERVEIKRSERSNETRSLVRSQIEYKVKDSYVSSVHLGVSGFIAGRTAASLFVSGTYGHSHPSPSRDRRRSRRAAGGKTRIFFCVKSNAAYIDAILFRIRRDADGETISKLIGTGLYASCPLQSALCQQPRRINDEEDA